jgi:hypothetical protein
MSLDTGLLILMRREGACVGSLWSFLQKPKNQKTLSWLGAGGVVVITGLWFALVYFFPPTKDGGSSGPQVKIDSSVKAGDCGFANSGTATGNTLNCGPPAAKP